MRRLRGVRSRVTVLASMREGTRVLLVEDDGDLREMLALSLSSRGAVTREAETGEEAIDIASTWPPDIVIMDLSLPGIDGFATLARIRAQPGCRDCAAVALTGHGQDLDRARSLAAGFAKHLVKPAAMADIFSALQHATVAPADSPDDVREMLREINATGSCQYTSVLRFSEAGTLVSIWTYNREAPGEDSFPVDMPITASYCVKVREHGATWTTSDAKNDPRVASHPRRDELASYLGVPLRRADGTLFGTLCSFDPEPREFTEQDRRAHEAAAVALGRIVDGL